MEYLGIPFAMKNRPELDPAFLPLGGWRRAYLAGAERPVRIAVEREDGQIAVFETRLRGEKYAQANLRFLERTVKLLLWSVGGFRVYLAGAGVLTGQLRAMYGAGGARAFDARFMETVYERPFEIVEAEENRFPQPREEKRRIGGHLNGCRIGFDAGGSDRKVSAVIDGETVYSEEVVWHPKTAEDPQYHLDGIVAAFRAAAARMPRVDGIGVSSAGVFIGSRPMVSSLFLRVPDEKRGLVRSIYERAAREIGDVPLAVANDGDVTALAGAMRLGCGAVLGLAMGTSEAAGYVDVGGRLRGWLNELAFAPVDLSEDAERDEWSGDTGVGCKYFSQDAVARLARTAGLALEEGLTQAEKLRAVQQLAEDGSECARGVFRSVGVYLGHTLPLYAGLYDLRVLIVLGRAASGVGGELIVSECRRVLREEYPTLAGVRILLPDEQFRRVGQSVAAASLPQVKKRT